MDRSLTFVERSSTRPLLGLLRVLIAMLLLGSGAASAQGGYIAPQTGYEQNPYAQPYGQNPYTTSPYGQNPNGPGYTQPQDYGTQDGYGYADDGTAGDVSMFYHALAPYGDWFYVPAYGYVWYPYVDHATWRPYMNDGYWVYSEYGWTWVSTVEWGWAPFHYGRWVYLDNQYWVWVPDTVWGPAWVAWRYSDEHVGWAPLPPGAYWYPQTGLEITVNLPLAWWIFVPGARLIDVDIYRYVMPYQRTNRIYYASRPSTTYTVQAGVPVCVGIELMYVRRWVGAPIRQVSITLTTQPGYYRHGTRGSVMIYRPSANRPDRRVVQTPPPPRQSAPSSLQYLSAPPPPRGGISPSQVYGRQSAPAPYSTSPSQRSSGSDGVRSPYYTVPGQPRREGERPSGTFTTVPRPPVPAGGSEAVRQEQSEVRQERQELRDEVKELRHEQRTGASSSEIKTQRQEVRDQAREVRHETQKAQDARKEVKETRQENQNGKRQESRPARSTR